MIRKTFATKPEAEAYAEEMRKTGGVAVVGSLGDKFRVYASTKDEIENRKKWNFTQPPECYLRDQALNARDDVGNALALKKSMDTSEVYNDYESAIEAARIMAEWGELKSAGDVFDFIDDTKKYNGRMKYNIDCIFADYDYEGKEEVKAE